MNAVLLRTAFLRGWLGSSEASPQQNRRNGSIGGPVLVALIIAAGLSLAGCEPPAPVGGAAAAPGGPPPPPGGAPPGVTSPAATPGSAAAGSLPADLVQKIDALIQSHKEYIAVAEQVQDQQAAKARFDELSAIAQRGSDAHDDVMIATKQLSPLQMAEWEAYMDKHVTPVNETRRQHRSRVEGLLPQ